ncbi:MAG: permease prefix domain 1-containing protein [Jiangellaceae bacterium]
MAGHALIDAHVAALRRRLPADAVDELADGLVETFDHHIRDGMGPDRAASAAIAEFGSVEDITRAFTRDAPGRRVALVLLATGPLVGVSWGAALIAAQAWAWPVPAGVRLLFGALLLAVVAALLAVAFARTNYARTRLTALSGTGLILLDAAMLAAVALAATALVWPMALAVTASLARIGLTLRVLPRVLAS